MNYYIETTYRKGQSGHIHKNIEGEKWYCSKSHKKPDYFKFWITIIGLVELIIIFALINKAW